MDMRYPMLCCRE